MDALIRERLAAVLATGSTVDLAAWASTGPEGVLALRDELEGTHTTEPVRSAHPRDIIDNLSAAAAAIASAEPEAFLATFAADRWASNTFVLVGLGRIDDERATERLLRATSSPNEWARMHAAIGLADRRSEAVAAALVRLLADTQYLVRYHALRSLATSGTIRVLPDVERFEPLTDIERSLRDAAVAQIGGRDSSVTPTN